MVCGMQSIVKEGTRVEEASDPTFDARKKVGDRQTREADLKVEKMEERRPGGWAAS